MAFIKRDLGEKEVARARSSAREEGEGEGGEETGRGVDDDDTEETGGRKYEEIFGSVDLGTVVRGRSESTCLIGEATALTCGRSSGALDSGSR